MCVGGVFHFDFGVLDDIAERFEINLPQSLFVRPGAEVSDARHFGVVEREMFDIGVTAFFRRAFDDGRRHFSAEEGIFRIILEISSRKRGAVDVHGGAVPALYVVSLRQGLFPDRDAHFPCQRGVEGRGDDDFRAVGAAPRRAPEGGKALRPVKILCFGLAQGIDFARIVCAVDEYEIGFFIIVLRQLIEVIFPDLVPVRNAAHIGQNHGLIPVCFGHGYVVFAQLRCRVKRL